MKGFKHTAVLLWIALACVRASAAYQYKVIVWSYDGDPRAAGFTAQHFGHTWATYLKVWVPDSSGKGIALYPGRAVAAPRIMEQYTMSWYPASLNMTPGFSRKGAKFSLAQTITISRQGTHRLASSGPVTITPEYFEKARRAVLDASSPDQNGRWGTDDFLFRFLIKDCIHKVSDIEPTFHKLHTGTKHGESASIEALRWMVDHGWAIEQPKDAVDYSLESQIFQRYGLNPSEVDEFNTETDVPPPPVFPHLARMFQRWQSCFSCTHY